MKVQEFPTHPQLKALAHALVDRMPELLDDAPELEDRLKWGCARNGWAYHADTVRKAVDATLWLRRKRGAR